jgi:hypothetical protein
MTRFCAITAPALLLTYGIARWIDGLNGRRHDGFAWDFGHLAFLLAIALFAVLAVRLVQGTRRRVVAGLAATAALLGAACFLWVIVGDLFSGFRDAAPLPGPLEFIGPVLFQLGLLTLLVLHVIDRRLPVWTPAFVLIGFAMIGANLDLLPLAALVIGAGLLPLAHSTAARHGTTPVGVLDK